MDRRDSFPVPPGQHPPFATVTSTDHRAWIIITTTVGIACTMVFGGLRVVMRATLQPTVGMDDVALAASTVVAFVQGTLILVACSHGLGKSVSVLPAADQIAAQKLYYASNLLFVVSLGLSKLSVVALLQRLSLDRSHRNVMYTAMTLVLAWTAASIMALALQCDLAAPWRSLNTRCPGSLLRWQIIGACDIATEVGLVGIALFLVWSLHTRVHKKLAVVAVFSFRLPLLVPIAFRLATFSPRGFERDPTLTRDRFVVWSQCQLSYAIMSATIPVIKQLMRDFNTLHGGLGSRGLASAGLSRWSKLNPIRGNRLPMQDDEISMVRLTPDRYNAAISMSGTDPNAGGDALQPQGRVSDGESTVSHNGTTRNAPMVIRKDTSWEVVHESGTGRDTGAIVSGTKGIPVFAPP